MTRRHFVQLGALAMLAPLLGRALPRHGSSTCDSAEAVTEGLDLRGLTAVVTGCNSGIGYETMHVLALRGAHVIGSARTLAKGEQACAGIAGRATPVVLDLADFDSVVACADRIAKLTPRVDMLVCNAGIVLGGLEQVRGLEKQFVVNHLGHFLLANRLLDRVTAAPKGRVVVVGSGSHRDAPPGGIQFDDLSGAGWLSRGYAHSKLANGLFSLELARRLRGTNATSNCVTPGHARTNILRHVGNAYREGAKTPAQAAATVCYAAAHPALAGVSGGYFGDCAPVEPHPLQTDTAMATRLWDVSEALTREYLDRPRRA